MAFLSKQKQNLLPAFKTTSFHLLQQSKISHRTGKTVSEITHVSYRCLNQVCVCSTEIGRCVSLISRMGRRFRVKTSWILQGAQKCANKIVSGWLRVK